MNLQVVTQSQFAAVPLADINHARQFIRSRHSDATRRAYASDVLAFKGWCDSMGLEALPATPETVVLFISGNATLRPSTLTRRLAAIRHIHKEAGFASPADAEIVKSALSGIKRVCGTSARKVAPATADKVQSMLAMCGDGLQGCRDRALLALGFGGAFRRSELVRLTVEAIQIDAQGLRVRLGRSKTDQEGAGQVVPVLDGARIKVRAALEAWLQASGITSGPVFRSISKGGRISDKGLSDRSVADIVKHRAEQAGLEPSMFSGHSLRAGFLTSAAASGANLFKMMEVSRHRKVDTVRGYIRMADQFKDHAGQAFM